MVLLSITFHGTGFGPSVCLSESTGNVPRTQNVPVFPKFTPQSILAVLHLVLLPTASHTSVQRSLGVRTKFLVDDKGGGKSHNKLAIDTWCEESMAASGIAATSQEASVHAD